jgi:hypothetical protein
MDKVKAHLDDKAIEKKQQLRDEFNANDAFDDEGGAGGAGGEEIIDEEELMLLKEMKDLKRNYRDNYDKLKALKSDVSDLETNIDNMK